MTLPLPQTPQQALRLVAAVLTVSIALVLGSLGASEPARPKYHHSVAFGDSYPAAPYVPLTDVAYGCYRASNNYPHLLAAALHIEDLRDRSCTGARTRDLPGSQTTAQGMKVPPQFDALTAETDLVTVSIGFNNERLYARMATVCRKSTRVCRLHDQRDELHATVDRLRPELVTTLEEIKERSPEARVLLVSYPRVLPPRGDCRRLPRMRPQDRQTFRAVNLRLRDEMEAAAADVEVEFVDFYAASFDHHVCSSNPWVQGRVGSNRAGAALHPLPKGQAALARILEQVLRKQPPKGLNDQARQTGS